ncbi:hypothetical protein MVEN_01963000 [Mycena venus]|uniref:Uncharacterized protein n=1 Tax=Mycena venus TaxID=2733690 RepID=A0A8H6XHA6_9AGAR|nr:hypothetical protein MVEN_01963000 [Mycena venus]
MVQLSFLSVILLSAIAETFLYGIFIVSFIVAVYLRLSKYTDRTARSGAVWNAITIPTIATFVICSAHWIIGVIRLFKGFGGSEDIRSALNFLSDPAEPLSAARSILVILNNLIGDAIIIQRLWFIWGRSLRVIIVPVLSWLGIIIAGSVVLYLLTHFGPGNISYTRAWITVGWALTTVTNIYCTACIAWKIWRTNRVTQAIGGGLLTYVLVILVESAAIWAVWAVFFAVTTQIGSLLEILATDLAPPIINLVNVLIYLRVGLGWSFAPSVDETAGVTMTTVLMLPTMSEQDDLDAVTAIPGTTNKA